MMTAWKIVYKGEQWVLVVEEQSKIEMLFSGKISVLSCKTRNGKKVVLRAKDALYAIEAP